MLSPVLFSALANAAPATNALAACCTAANRLLSSLPPQSHAEMPRPSHMTPLQVDRDVLRRCEPQDTLLNQQYELHGRNAIRVKKSHETDAYMSATVLPPLLRFCFEFSPDVWHTIVSLFPHQAYPEALDIDCTYGRAAIELARRGFRVMGIEPDVHLLARARMHATVSGVEVQLLGADQEPQRLAAGSTQLVSVMHGFHLLQASSALPEIHRLLRPGGYLVAAWNDRDTTDPFVQDLESLMEATSPSYDRAQRLHDPDTWLPTLTKDGLFELHAFEEHSNTMRLRQVSELVDLMASMSFMQMAWNTEPARRKQFAQEVRAIAARHFESFDEIQLPLVSKLYVMKRVG